MPPVSLEHCKHLSSCPSYLVFLSPPYRSIEDVEAKSHVSFQNTACAVMLHWHGPHANAFLLVQLFEFKLLLHIKISHKTLRCFLNRIIHLLMNTFRHGFQGLPKLQKVGEEGEGERDCKWEGRRDTNQTLDVLSWWQGWGTESSWGRSSEWYASAIKQTPAPHPATEYHYVSFPKGSCLWQGRRSLNDSNIPNWSLLTLNIY